MASNFLLIKIISKFEWLFRKAGIDFDTLVTILKLKLTLDDRKTASTMSMSSDTKPGKLQGMKANLLMQAFVGLFLGFVMFLPLDLFFKVTTIVSMDFFFMVMYMISDFSSVLLDVRDKNIIMTKPVDNRTMNAARIIHIAYYMILLFLALNLASIVIGVMKHGFLFLLSYVVMMVFLCFFIIFLATILYSVLLNRFNGEKLKDIINTFQIVLSVVTIIAYQLMGRVFEFAEATMTLNIDIKWWTYLLPPAWFGGLFKVIVEQDFTLHFVAMALLSIFVPIILGTILIKTIMPKFESYLSKLQIEDGVFIDKNNIITRLKEHLYQLVSKDNVERAFMRFTDYNLSRDRRLKLMIYPNHTMSFIFPLIIILPFLQDKGSLLEGIQSLNGTDVYLSLYLAMMFFITNFEFLQFSENYEAAFIYDSFPIANRHVVLKGAMKAYYIKYVMPAMLILSTLYGFLCGTSVIPDLIFINIASVLVLSIRVNLFPVELPFSKPFGTTGNKNLAMTFGFMGICGVLALFHFLLLRKSVIFTMVMCLVTLILIKGVEWLKGKKYSKLKNTDYSMDKI